MRTKNLIKNFCLLCLPFFIMVATNLLYKPKPQNTTYAKFGITTQNTAKKLKTKCTWVCHNNTIYCKQNHVKFNHKYSAFTDKYYFGSIKWLNAGGNYEMANIIFLVVLIPLAIWFFISRSLNLNSKIKQLKKQNGL